MCLSGVYMQTHSHPAHSLWPTDGIGTVIAVYMMMPGAGWRGDASGQIDRAPCVLVGGDTLHAPVPAVAPTSGTVRVLGVIVRVR